MASKQHEIKTIFALDGETKYRDAIKNIKEQQRGLRFEMTLLDDTYKLNGDRVEYNKGKVEVLNKQIDLQKKRVDEARNAVEKSTKIYGENSEETARYKRELGFAENKLETFKRELDATNAELKKQQNELYKSAQKIKDVGDKFQKTGEKMSKVGSGLTRGVTAPLAAIGAAATAAWMEVDENLDNIAKATGATGKDLEDLQQSFENVVREIPADMDAVADAVGELNTQFGWTGERLEQATEYAVKFGEIADTDVVSAVQGAKKAMETFGVEAENFEGVLDAAAKAAQDTGVGVDKIWESVRRAGPSLKELDIPLNNAIKLIAEMEQQGIDANRMMGYLATAQSRLAKEGKTLQQGLKEFGEIVDANVDSTEQMNAASALFGQKGGQMMLDAARRGAINFGDLADAANDAAGTVAATFDATLDPIDRYKVALNNAKLAGKELSQALQVATAPMIEKLVEFLQGATDSFRSLDAETQQFIIKSGLLLAAMGPLLSVTGKVTSGIGKMTTGWGNFIEKIASTGGVLGGFVSKIGAAGTAGLAGAVALAAVGIYKLVKRLTEVDPAVKKAREAVESFNGKLEDGIAQYRTQERQLENYAQELEALREIEGKSAAQKERVVELVRRLNELMPDLNLEYDREGDLLSINRDRMRELVAASKEWFKEEVRQKIINEIIEDQGETYSNLIKKQMEFNKIQRATSEIQERVNRLYLSGLDEQQIRMAEYAVRHNDFSRLNIQLTQDQIDTVKGLNATLDNHKDALKDTSGVAVDSWTTSTQALNNLSAAGQTTKGDINALMVGYNNLETQINETTTAMSALTGTHEKLGDAAEEAGDKAETAAKKHGDAVVVMGHVVKTTLDAQSDEYNEYADGLTSKAEQFMRDMNGFTGERLDYETASTDDFIRLWEKEAEAFENYQKNMKTIAARVPEDVAAELEKLGPEAAPLIEKFANASDEELNRLVAAFRRKSGLAVDAATEELGELKTRGYEAGRNYAQSIINGAESKRDQLRRTGNKLGNALNTGTTQSLEMHSPSKKGQYIGENFPQSIIDEIRKHLPAVKIAGGDIGDALYDGTKPRVPEVDLPTLDVMRRAPMITSPSIPIGGGTTTNNNNHSTVVNVAVPEGETVDFGRRVGQAIAREMRHAEIGRGR